MERTEDSLGKLGETISVRLQPNIDFLLKEEAHSLNTTKSIIVRDICSKNYENKLQDQQLLYQALEDNRSKIRFLEHKIDLLAVMLLEQTRLMLKIFPSDSTEKEYVTDAKVSQFLNTVETALKGNHGSMIENIVLDIYTKGE